MYFRLWEKIGERKVANSGCFFFFI